MNSTNSLTIQAYCDADWGNDTDERKSTTGYVIMINGCLVIWNSKKQSTVALSSAEAEYMAISGTVQEIIVQRYNHTISPLLRQHTMLITEMKHEEHTRH